MSSPYGSVTTVPLRLRSLKQEWPYQVICIVVLRRQCRLRQVLSIDYRPIAGEKEESVAEKAVPVPLCYPAMAHSFASHRSCDTIVRPPGHSQPTLNAHDTVNPCPEPQRSCVQPCGVESLEVGEIRRSLQH